MAAEVLLATPAVRALVREGKSHQIYSQMQTGGRIGMKTMTASLAEAVRKGQVRIQDAESVLSDPSEFLRLVRAA